MSLIIPRNFKRAKAQGAQDAQGDEVIAQKNGYKLVHNTLNDGYWFYTKSGAGWGIKATNKIAAINEFNRLVGSAKDAAELNNAAELRVVNARGIGKWWVEPNLSRFNDTDRERTFKGRKEFPDREAAMKYARGTGKTFIVNDACEDSGELNNDADLRAADSISDKEREYTRLYELAQKNITFYAAKGDSAKVAEWKRKADEYKRLAQEA